MLTEVLLEVYRIRNLGFALLLGVLVHVVFKVYSHLANRRVYPPGPKPRWIRGNKIPKERQWLKFHEWSKIYGKYFNVDSDLSGSANRHNLGDVVYITIMGQPTVVLSSLRAASDLLDTRGKLDNALLAREKRPTSLYNIRDKLF